MIKPRYSNWQPYFFNKVTDTPEKNSITLPNTREEIIKFLKWWNTTAWNNACTVDIISYEQLIYYEMKFSEDEQIQILIKILKQKISKLYELKAKYMDILIDKNLYKDLTHFRSQYGADAKIYSCLDAGEIQWRPE